MNHPYLPSILPPSPPFLAPPPFFSSLALFPSASVSLFLGALALPALLTVIAIICRYHAHV